MTLDNFTIKAQDSIQKAQQIAGGYDQQHVDTVHLIKGIILTDENVPNFLLKKMEVNLAMLDTQLGEEIKKYPKVEGTDKQYLTENSNKAMSRAKKMLKEFDDEFISVELILLAIVQGKEKGGEILRNLGASDKGMRAAIEELRKGHKVKSQHSETQYNALEKFAINLNQRAESGELDPIIGRDEEIRRVLHILSPVSYTHLTLPTKA